MRGWSKAWTDDWEDRVAGEDEPMSRKDFDAWSKDAAAFVRTVAECAVMPIVAFVASMPRIVEVEFAYGDSCRGDGNSRDGHNRQRHHHRRSRDRR
jgi:hypothetical protein